MDSHLIKLDEANRLVDAGHFAKALELLSGLIQEVSAKSPLKGHAYLVKVRALIGLGNLEEALHLVEQVLDGKERQVLQSILPYFLHERARIAHFLDDKRGAIAYYREELLYLSSSMSRYFPRLADNYIAQGTIFLELGDRAECDIYLMLAHDYVDKGTSDGTCLLYTSRCV